MIYRNFSKYDIDVEKGTIFSFYKNDFKSQWVDDNGYIRCGVTDDKGNSYVSLHQIIYCAVNGITKDELPRNPNGRLYDIDHIDGNNKNNNPNNLVLKSHADNIRNENTRKRLSVARKKEKNPNYGKHVSDENKDSLKDAVNSGFCEQGIRCCCKGLYKHHHNYIWKYSSI